MFSSHDFGGSLHRFPLGCNARRPHGPAGPPHHHRHADMVLHDAANAIEGGRCAAPHGANVELQAMDWSTLVQRRASKAPPSQGGWNIFVANATLTGIANPLLNTFTRHCEDTWFGWPCDSRVPELIRDCSFESDPAARQRILKRLEAVHVETVTNIPLGQYRSCIAYRRNLKGLLPGPALFYWNIEKA